MNGIMHCNRCIVDIYNDIVVYVIQTVNSQVYPSWCILHFENNSFWTNDGTRNFYLCSYLLYGIWECESIYRNNNMHNIWQNLTLKYIIKVSLNILGFSNIFFIKPNHYILCVFQAVPVSNRSSRHETLIPSRLYQATPDGINMPNIKIIYNCRLVEQVLYYWCKTKMKNKMYYR